MSAALPSYASAASRRPPIAPGRPSAPTPRIAWALALLLSLMVAVGIVYPKAGIGFVGVAMLVFAVWRILVRPLNGIVIALCVYPVYPVLRAAYTAFGIPIAVSGTRLWPEALLGVVLVGIVIGHIRRRERMRLFWDDLPALIFLGAGFYGLAVSLYYLPPIVPLMGMHVSLTSLFFYFAIRLLRPSPQQCRRLLAVLLVTYTVLAAISLVDFVFRPLAFRQLANAMRPHFRWEGWDAAAYWALYPRMQSLLYDENVWGSLSALVSFFCVANFIYARPAPVYRFLFLLSTACVVFSMSRGAMLSWVVGVCVLLLLRGRHRPRIVAMIVVVVALGAWAMIVLAQDPRTAFLMARLDEINTNLASGNIASDRTHQWVSAWDIFVRQPSGTGLGTAGYAAFLSQLGTHIVGDSSYFRILAEQGVPGILAFLVTLVGLAWVLLRHLPATTGLQRVLGMTILAYLCATTAHSVVATTWDYYYTMPVFWILIGLFVTRQIAAAQEQAGSDLAVRPRLLSR